MRGLLKPLSKACPTSQVLVLKTSWWVTVTLVILQCLANITEAEMSRQAILNHLLINSTYDSGIAPDFELNVPTNITVQILIQNIYSVSESSMDYSVDIFLRQSWSDRRLRYDHLSDSPWLELDNKLMDKVWTPDTYFPNEKRAYAHTVTIPNRLVHLYRNGTVLYSVRLSLTLSCSMLLQKYPFDKQRCPLYIESYGYTIGNIDYLWREVEPITLSVEVEMPQFEPDTGVKFEKCDKEYVGKFSCLSAEILLTRKVGYYIVQIFVPSILIVVLSWISFWVDYDAVPARVSLGIMTVLTMTTQSSGTRQSLPQVSYVKAIDVWMAVCLLFVFAALLEYAYVNVVSRRRMVPSTIFVQKEPQTIETIELQGKDENVLRPGIVRRDNKQWSRSVEKASRVIFPALFLAFNVIFWIYYTMIA